MPRGIAYVDGPRLARSRYAAADWVHAGREEINRINVFPVPDGDTGTNFSLTLRAISDALRARGNSGMMLAHFLLGFAESIGNRATATAPDVARALRRGADTLYSALDEPREGTILTVARDAASAAEKAAETSEDMADFMRRLLAEGQQALARTPSLLAVLREAGVVDAGGKGFFVKTFRSSLAEADEVVAVLLSSGLSGTFQAGQAAVKAANLDHIELFDSKSASLGLGMLALRAAELAESGWNAKTIVNELERVRSQSGLFLTVDRYENLLRSGRVSRGKAWLAGMLDVKPILSLDQTGRVVPVDRVRGRDQLVARVLQWVDRALTPRPRALRFGIAHAESPETAERLRTALVAAYQPRDCFVALATGVLGTHAGPGAWAVCYQVEDGTPELQGKESRG